MASISERRQFNKSLDSAVKRKSANLTVQTKRPCVKKYTNMLGSNNTYSKKLSSINSPGGYNTRNSNLGAYN